MTLLPPELGNPLWTDNWTLGHPALHGEVMEPETGRVWLVQQPLSREVFDALVLPEGFVKTGIGESVADLAFFRSSPGSEDDAPLEVREIGGLRFGFVARPGVPEAVYPGLFVLPVHKKHRLLYRAGRRIEIMDAGDGQDYLPLVAKAAMAGREPGSRERRLPEGWSIREVTLIEDLVVELPCPTRVTFFTSGDSFQGPLRLGL